MTRALTTLLTLLSLSTSGASLRPVVTFTPDWNKTFLEESVTMTCNGESTQPGDPVINWYKDNNWVYTGKVYTIAQAQYTDSGSYQCQAEGGERSNAARLEVYNSYVILQTPLHVYEGDNVTLRCHHYPGYEARQTIFYREQKVVQDWGSKDELLVENVDMKSYWKYSCTKEVYHDLLYYQYSGDATISVQELFTSPDLKLLEYPDTTLVCDTRLSLLRRTTELQFAFDRDGQEVQGFSTSNVFVIPSALLESVGTYKCQVRTPNNSVVKTSQTLTTAATIKVLADAVSPLLVTFVVLGVLLLILVGLALFRVIKIRFPGNIERRTDLQEPLNEHEHEREPLLTNKNHYFWV